MRDTTSQWAGIAVLLCGNAILWFAVVRTLAMVSPADGSDGLSPITVAVVVLAALALQGVTIWRLLVLRRG